ncbi:MAG: DUF1549 domain-containing protein [Isosphaeraceae bacterium]
MVRQQAHLVALGAVVVCLLGGIVRAEDGPAVDYLRDVKPILKARCFACHGALKQQAGLRLDSVSAMRQGGDGGPAVVAHDPGASPLLERVASGDSNERMPPEGPPLTLSQIESLRGWVLAGAAGPPGERPEEDPRRHWAFVPPVRPRVPEIGASTGGDRRGVFDPIDAFLEVERRRAGVPALPPAPRLIWLRRVSLDLTGLPPTREEQDAFCRDTSPIAFERVVDRLLASPQYGERWARHWMDVWRYSDWYGRRAVPDVLNSYAQIWRWRDWIVANLNRDRGYDAMLRAMLAADELTPTDASELVATGFLVRNWYRWNYNTWMKDNVEHVSKALIGLTVNCAHCHDHKYDPITQNDYFALRAIFEPLELRHDRVPGEPDPGPYPKYDYGKAYGPIRSGLVRVFDEKLDAQTFLYTKGESRNIVPGRPPIEPGVPRFLQGDRFKVEPVALPPESSYPGLQEFVQHDERVRLVASCRAAAEARDKTRAEAHALRRELSHRWAAWSPDVPLAFVDPLLAVPAFRNGSAPPVELARLVARAGVVLRAGEVDEAVARAAECELEAFEARVRADAVRHGRVPGDATAERGSRIEPSREPLAKAEAEVPVPSRPSPRHDHRPAARWQPPRSTPLGRRGWRRSPRRRRCRKRSRPSVRPIRRGVRAGARRWRAGSPLARTR